MKRNLLFLLALTISGLAGAQNKWDLRQCVDYAIQNNISVRQTDLQARFSELNFTQSKASQLPTLSLGGTAVFV